MITKHLTFLSASHGMFLTRNFEFQLLFLMITKHFTFLSASHGMFQTRNFEFVVVRLPDERLHHRRRGPRVDVAGAASLRVPDSKVYRTWQISKGTIL